MDSVIVGQIEAVEFVLQTDNQCFIPGHGLGGGREVPEQQLRFLKDLYASVKRHYDQGLADFEMKELVASELVEYRDWYKFGETGLVIGSVCLKVGRSHFESSFGRLKSRFRASPTFAESFRSVFRV